NPPGTGRSYSFLKGKRTEKTRVTPTPDSCRPDHEAQKAHRAAQAAAGVQNLEPFGVVCLSGAANRVLSILRSGCNSGPELLQSLRCKDPAEHRSGDQTDARLI